MFLPRQEWLEISVTMFTWFLMQRQLSIKKGLNGEEFSAETIHQTALASLNEEFAQVVDSEFIKEII